MQANKFRQEGLAAFANHLSLSCSMVLLILLGFIRRKPYVLSFEADEPLALCISCRDQARTICIAWLHPVSWKAEIRSNPKIYLVLNSIKQSFVCMSCPNKTTNRKMYFCKQTGPCGHCGTNILTLAKKGNTKDGFDRYFAVYKIE